MRGKMRGEGLGFLEWRCDWCGWDATVIHEDGNVVEY